VTTFIVVSSLVTTFIVVSSLVTTFIVMSSLVGLSPVVRSPSIDVVLSLPRVALRVPSSDVTISVVPAPGGTLVLSVGNVLGMPVLSALTGILASLPASAGTMTGLSSSLQPMLVASAMVITRMFNKCFIGSPLLVKEGQRVTLQRREVKRYVLLRAKDNARSEVRAYFESYSGVETLRHTSDLDSEES
jgi:hypothetical protein